MDIYKRLGMYFFTFGALLSILAGAFKLGDGMHEISLVILIFLGVFSAILNIDEEEEIGFLVAAASFLIAILTFQVVLANHPLVLLLTRFFEVATFFVGSMVGVVGLKTIIEFGSMDETRDPLQHADEISDRMDTLLLSPAEHFWNVVVFFAVAISFIVILLDVFFSLENFLLLFFYIDLVITLVFFIDLIVLYKKEKSFFKFLKNCWLDILATIPFFNIFRVFKIARLIKLTKFLKLNKTLKLMTAKSGVRHYIRGDLQGIQERSANEQARRGETERSTRTSARTVSFDAAESEPELKLKRAPIRNVPDKHKTVKRQHKK